LQIEWRWASTPPRLSAPACASASAILYLRSRWKVHTASKIARISIPSLPIALWHKSRCDRHEGLLCSVMWQSMYDRWQSWRQWMSVHGHGAESQVTSRCTGLPTYTYVLYKWVWCLCDNPIAFQNHVAQKWAYVCVRLRCTLDYHSETVMNLIIVIASTVAAFLTQ
jgi:hypothetical protein